MAESAGTVYAEIRIALEKLQGDVSKVNGLIASVGQGIDKQNQQTKTQSLTQSINKSFQNMSKSGINEFARLVKGINTAFMALPIIGLITMVAGSIKGLVDKVFNWVESTTKVYIENEQAVAKMNRIMENTGAIAWTNSKLLQQQSAEIAASTGLLNKQVIDVQTQLLSYPAIAGKMFERAVKGAFSAADCSTARKKWRLQHAYH